MEAIRSSRTLVLTRGTWCNIPGDGILQQITLFSMHTVCSFLKYINDRNLIYYLDNNIRMFYCNILLLGSLSALVYQHSLMPMALPCRLLLPEGDGSRLPADNSSTVSTAQLLLAQGAGECNLSCRLGAFSSIISYEYTQLINNCNDAFFKWLKVISPLALCS
jgi:hypothetical protein